MIAGQLQPDAYGKALSQIGFLPEKMQDLVAMLFSRPERGASYLWQVQSELVELSAKATPPPETVPLLIEVFRRLHPHYDLDADLAPFNPDRDEGANSTFLDGDHAQRSLTSPVSADWEFEVHYEVTSSCPTR